MVVFLLHLRLQSEKIRGFLDDWSFMRVEDGLVTKV